MIDHRYLAFVAVAALLTITPGPDMAIVARSALRGGTGAALRTTLGINAGLAAWALAAAAGLAAVLAASSEAFATVRLAGGAYLVWLGGRSLRRARAPADARPPRRPFREGLVANLLNPKIGVFYATLLPQFLVPGRSVILQSLALATVRNVMGLVWLPAFGRAVSGLGARAARRLERVTGVVLVGLGLRVAFAHR